MKQLLELFLSFINIWSLGSLLRNRLSDVQILEKERQITN